MLPQTLAVNKALPTFAALVGSLSGVKPVVHLQFLRSRVTFPADAADERPVFDVRLVMCRQIRVYPKRLPADGARERSLPGVLHLVQLQGGSRVETSAALGAEERFLPGVYALVNLYVALVDEPLAAVRTRVGFLLDVGFHVLLQLFFLIELNATAAAEEKLRRAVLGRVRFASWFGVCSNVVCL